MFWRPGEEEENFNDWSIEVTASTKSGDTKTTTYHVHRSMLAMGPNRSSYFETLFRSHHQFRESANNTSEVTLTEDQAAAFPDFLDYLYCPLSESKGLVKKENCHSLHYNTYIANYFLVPHLIDDIDNFIREDITCNNLGHLEKYLADFCGGEEEPPQFLLAHATRACAEMILSIEVGSSLLAALSPAMFLQIMVMARGSNMESLPDSDQYHIGCLAVEYGRSHQAILDANYFSALMCYLRFPVDVKLTGRLAIDLLEIMELAGWEASHAFKDFCAAALSRYLSADDGPGMGEIHVIAKKIPQDVVITLLAESLNARRVSDVQDIVVSCTIVTGIFHRHVGNTHNIHLKSNDSVNFIMYEVGHLLDVASYGYGFSVCHEGFYLRGEQIMSALGISSGAELEIRG